MPVNGVATTRGMLRTSVDSRGARLAVAVAMVASISLFFATSSSSAAGDPVIAAAGDIACDPSVPWFNGGNGTPTDCQEMATASLLTGVDAVLPLGDTQYNCGGATAYGQSYDPSWGGQGQLKAISHPVPGNHEYWVSGGTDCSSQPDAAGYFSYFGASAGDPTKGYYSYDLGAWHIIALNSECSYVASVGNCDSGSPEETWLRNDLAAHSTAACTLAYWHRPRFASSDSGGDTSFSQFWSDLYAARADVVLNGHAHWYERFALQNASGQADPNGLREFIIGTGGEENGSGPTAILPNSEARASGMFGVLKMTLHPGSYDWNYVPTPGSATTFTDSGSTSCHNAVAGPDTTAPTTAISCDGATCLTGWSAKTSVAVTLSATDTGGSGVSTTRYTTDGTDPVSSASAVTYTGPFSVSQTTTVKFASTDNAGNQEATGSRQIRIDAAAPTVTITSPTAGSSFKRGTNIVITANATDVGTGSASPSGVALVTFYRDSNIKLGSDSTSPYSHTWSTSGRALGSHTLKVVAKDVAGNSSTPSTVTVTLTR